MTTVPVKKVQRKELDSLPSQSENVRLRNYGFTT